MKNSYSREFRTVRLVCLFILTLMGFNAHGWSIEESCDGTVGAQVGKDFFSLVTFSDEEVLNGASSCKMEVIEGSDGWGDWGGVVTFPEPLGRGKELWVRLNIFVPEEFDHTALSQLKFMRVSTRGPSNENHGYLDFLITPDGRSHWDSKKNEQTDAPYYYYYETVVNQAFLGEFGQGGFSPNKGRWESYELYYFLDHESSSEGGQGRVRIWRNNKLIADLDDQITLKTELTRAKSFFLFTYWNGGAPKTQHVYVDDIKVTSERPPNLDSAGNAFIGGDREDLSKASPPTFFSAELK